MDGVCKEYLKGCDMIDRRITGSFSFFGFTNGSLQNKNIYWHKQT